MSACPILSQLVHTTWTIGSAEDAAANQLAVLSIQRANIREGLPPKYAVIPSCRAGVAPTYQKTHEYIVDTGVEGDEQPADQIPNVPVYDGIDSDRI